MHPTKRHVLDRIPLITSSNPQLLEEVSILVEWISRHVHTVSEDLTSRELIDNKWLSSTLLYVAKIDQLIKVLQKSGINKYIIPIEFWWWQYDLNYQEFMEYYRFEAKTPEAEIWKTTSTFQHTYQSINDPNIWVLYDEFYEHEDDTDGWQYYLLFQS